MTTSPARESPAPVLEYDAPRTRVWPVGTLSYDRRQLFNVFFWMLWGDFCLNLMDSSVTPALVTLQLKKYGASSATIGFLQGTVVEFMSIVMVAIISTWSDRHRGPLGRRMPFMLWSTPPIALFLILLGFSPQIAGWLQRAMPGLFQKVAFASLTTGVIAVTMTAYKFFDLFPQSVYYYLFADVIPHSVMGTFACLFRVFATAAGMIFNLLMLKHVEEHPAAICLLAALLYVLAFVGLTLRVKEGQYPPPPVEPIGPNDSKLSRVAGTVAQYAKESYTHPYYWTFYLFYLTFMCGYRPFGLFVLPYVKDTLKMDLGQYGTFLFFMGGGTMGVFFLMGPIIDRFHPMRVGLFGYVLMFASALCGYFFIRGTTSFMVWYTIMMVAFSIFQGANGALLPRILPRQQYGQFCSASAIVWHTGLMIAMWACGKLLDVTGDNSYIFIWYAGFSGVGVVVMFLLYLQWKALGGDEHYSPPVTAPGAVLEVEA